MTITGNKGEWSEIYAFLHLLAEGKLFTTDENLNKISNIFFPIIKIIREEVVGEFYEYCPNNQNIEIYFNGVQASVYRYRILIIKHNSYSMMFKNKIPVTVV